MRRRTRPPKHKRIQRKLKSDPLPNSLNTLAANIGALTGGSPLAFYGTIARHNNYALLTLNYLVLTYFYTSNGIFQRALQLPVQDALRGGLDIKSDQLDEHDLKALNRWIENSRVLRRLLDAMTWARLYGGGGLLINTNQDPETPLNINTLASSLVEFYALDRWELDTDNLASEFQDYYWGSGNRDHFYLSGVRIHKSRIILLRGKEAPRFVRRQLQGWGMSEGERIIEEINLYLKTKGVAYEILDESKIDVYYINNLANKLASKSGTQTVTQRIQAANQLKNYVNALVLDANEKYEQKTQTFTGLADMSKENRIGIAASIGMPEVKIFGLSPSGFNTGESDLENYNALVESDVRQEIRPPARQLIDIGMVQCFGFIPEYDLEFFPLRVLSAVDDENIKSSQTSRIIMMLQNNIITEQEAERQLKKYGCIDIKTDIEQRILPPPREVNAAEITPVAGLAERQDTASVEA